MRTIERSTVTKPSVTSLSSLVIAIFLMQVLTDTIVVTHTHNLLSHHSHPQPFVTLSMQLGSKPQAVEISEDQADVAAAAHIRLRKGETNPPVALNSQFLGDSRHLEKKIRGHTIIISG